ncbi:hypothetical protein Pan161_24130 [Gimesia algae]|uniref:Uncharacterized protein n=1 Tax=Gimesia algae TaxID=2527971 RepID=A0A517VCQ1_9PLAN|nr:hypothetical protein Pan161_24130 [Gimesia algae]
MLLAQLKTDHEYRSPEGTEKQTIPAWFTLDHS